MDILRIAENLVDGDIEITVSVPEGISGDLVVTITDLADLSKMSTEEEAVSGQEYTMFLSGKYDTSYLLEIYSVAEARVILEETYEISRPYVNPNTLGVTATDIAKAAQHEELARAIIDSIIPEGFYYKKKTIETSGTGSDYLPIWSDVKKVLSVTENNVLVTDRSYGVSLDKTAIVEIQTDAYNRSEGSPIRLPAGASDSDYVSYTPCGFVNGWDYSVVTETGYTAVPSDIKRAAELLIEDIACGKLDYYQRYVSSYNTDQFRIQFDKELFNGTGNLIVDKILSKYAKSITRLGAL